MPPLHLADHLVADFFRTAAFHFRLAMCIIIGYASARSSAARRSFFSLPTCWRSSYASGISAFDAVDLIFTQALMLALDTVDVPFQPTMDEGDA